MYHARGRVGKASETNYVAQNGREVEGKENDNQRSTVPEVHNPHRPGGHWG